jgi:hypothetical protein
VPDHAGHPAPGFQTDFGQLRGFPGARLTTEDEDLMFLYRPQDLLPLFNNRPLDNRAQARIQAAADALKLNAVAVGENAARFAHPAIFLPQNVPDAEASVGLFANSHRLSGAATSQTLHLLHWMGPS